MAFTIFLRTVSIFLCIVHRNFGSSSQSPDSDQEKFPTRLIREDLMVLLGSFVLTGPDV
jgi:hypothetical protein